MEWYYMRGGERMGPVSEAAFEALLRSGTIVAETDVWHEGMAQWQRYGEVQTEKAGVQAALGQDAAVGSYICSECGKLFPADEMVQYQDSWVCAACKPIFFQRLKEGAALPQMMAYAGFWIRFVAEFIDGVLLGSVNMAIGFAFGMGFAVPGALSPMLLLSFTLPSIIGFVLGVAYSTWFVGKFAATPGKMACGLKVIMSDGSQVTYWRALGRHFAKVLSVLILYIGYIMVAFDEEKRGLHDRICDTRVIHK